ncbi:MAG: helix-turn-helix transcriptional regulator [Gemmatimonadaceae bacterium]|nr:helix-turn-helix transcriptional regulator [Gemmatimonadaceae bacterium]
MRISTELSDAAILHELGARLASARLANHLTQAALAEQAGISKRTVERLESGEVATHLSGFLRVCRVLGLLARFDVLVPEPTPTPMEQLARQGRKRQRASSRNVTPPARKTWAWGDAP